MRSDAKVQAQPRGARFLMVAASLVVVVAGLRFVAPIALPLMLAVFLSILSAPLMHWMMARGLARPLAIIFTILTNFAVLAGVILLVGGSINAFSRSLPKYQRALEGKTHDAVSWLQERGIDTSELSWLEVFSEEPGETEGTATGAEPGSMLNLGAFMDLVTSTVRVLASALSNTLLVLLTMVFILFETAGLPRKLQRAFNWQAVELARLAKAQREVQRYLGIKTLVSLATGIALGIWVWALGVEYPLLWALLAFLFNYIPSLGSIIAAIPAVLFTMIEGSLGQALLVGLGYLVVNMVLGNVVEPHLMGRNFGLSTLVVFLSLVFWGWLWGPLGMLLSVPLTMIIKIMLENTDDLRWIAVLLGSSPAD